MIGGINGMLLYVYRQSYACTAFFLNKKGLVRCPRIEETVKEAHICMNVVHIPDISINMFHIIIYTPHNDLVVLVFGIHGHILSPTKQIGT